MLITAVLLPDALTVPVKKVDAVAEKVDINEAADDGDGETEVEYVDVAELRKVEDCVAVKRGLSETEADTERVTRLDLLALALTLGENKDDIVWSRVSGAVGDLVPDFDTTKKLEVADANGDWLGDMLADPLCEEMTEADINDVADCSRVADVLKDGAGDCVVLTEALTVWLASGDIEADAEALTERDILGEALSSALCECDAVELMDLLRAELAVSDLDPNGEGLEDRDL